MDHLVQEKEDRFVKLCEISQSPGLQERRKWLPCQQGKTTLLLCYHPSLSKNWSSGFIKAPTTEMCVLKFWMQHELQATMLQKDFSSMETFLNLMFCRLSRNLVTMIIVDIITRGSYPQNRIGAMEFHTPGSFCCLYKYTSSNA